MEARGLTGRSVPRNGTPRVLGLRCRTIGEGPFAARKSLIFGQRERTALWTEKTSSAVQDTGSGRDLCRLRRTDKVVTATMPEPAKNLSTMSVNVEIWPGIAERNENKPSPRGWNDTSAGTRASCGCVELLAALLARGVRDVGTSVVTLDRPNDSNDRCFLEDDFPKSVTAAASIPSVDTPWTAIGAWRVLGSMITPATAGKGRITDQADTAASNPSDTIFQNLCEGDTESFPGLW